MKSKTQTCNKTWWTQVKSVFDETFEKFAISIDFTISTGWWCHINRDTSLLENVTDFMQKKLNDCLPGLWSVPRIRWLEKSDLAQWGAERYGADWQQPYIYMVARGDTALLLKPLNNFFTVFIFQIEP